MSTISPSVLVYQYNLLPFDLPSSTVLYDAHKVFKSRMFYLTQRVLLILGHILANVRGSFMQ